MGHQELSIVPELSVAENVALGTQPLNRLGLVDYPRMTRDARRAQADRPARQPHGALVGRDHARDDLHQRALAGPVLADQAVDLAPPEGEIDAGERRHAAIALADARELQQRGGVR